MALRSQTHSPDPGQPRHHSGALEKPKFVGWCRLSSMSFVNIPDDPRQAGRLSVDIELNTAELRTLVQLVIEAARRDRVVLGHRPFAPPCRRAYLLTCWMSAIAGALQQYHSQQMQHIPMHQHTQCLLQRSRPLRAGARRLCLRPRRQHRRPRRRPQFLHLDRKRQLALHGCRQRRRRRRSERRPQQRPSPPPKHR